MQFIKLIFKNKYVFWVLVKRDFESRYLSSYIGLPWAFIQPIVYVFVMWFAFKYGLRAGNTADGIPFLPWLMYAMIPWMFISQTLILSSNAIIEYGYLIKKTDFPVELVPIVKIFSGLVIHITLIILITFISIFFYGFKPTIYWIQYFYYLFALIFLLSGISWFISSVNVFIKDMAHIVNIIITILFWLTPIIWPYSKLQGDYKYVALLNPFFYLTEGYRFTFIKKTWFFDYLKMNILFWCFAIVSFVIGAYTFKKLKPYFADEL